MGSPSLSRGTLQRSQFSSPGNATGNNQSKSTPFASRSKWDEPSDSDTAALQNEDKGNTVQEGVLYNAGGRNYSIDEMLDIFQEMKRNNVIKNSAEKNDLFHSIVPNGPAVLDPSLQQPFFYDAQHLDSSGADHPIGSNHNNQTSINPGNATPFADRLLSAKPSLSDLHKEALTHNKALGLSDGVESPAASNVLPGVTSSWSPFGAGGSALLSSNNESIFKSNGIIPKNDLFSPGVGFQTSTPPPGISSPVPTMVSPENINWIYKDPSGAEQGPFNGIRMQEWYSSKWLQDFLHIRRVEESEFYTLKDYMTKVNNFVEPFLVPQPIPGRGGYFEDPQQRMQEELLARQREALRRQQQLQFASLQLHQQQNSGWGSMSPIATPMSPMSPWVQPQQSQLHSALGGGSFDFSGLSGSQVNLNHLNNDVWQPRAPGSIPQTPRRVPSNNDLTADASLKRSIFDEFRDVKNTNKADLEGEDYFPEEAPTVSQSAIQPPSKSPPASEAPVPSQIAQQEPVKAPVSQAPEAEPVKEATKEEVSVKKSKKSKGKKSVPASGQQTPSVRAPPLPKTDALAEELTKGLEQVQIEKNEPEPEKPAAQAPVASPKPAAPALAPWAKKEVAAPKPLSIREIQEIEAAERKTRKAQQQQQQAAAAAVALLQSSRSGASTPVQASTPSLPSGATWATVGVPSPSAAPKKSLTQIQKEEEEAAARKRTPAATVPSAAGTRKYADVSAPSSVSYSARATAAPAASSTSTTSGGAWTTVGPGGKKVGAGLTSTPTSVPVSTAASPIHRKVELARTTTAPVAAAKLSSSSEEFLNWCKSSLTDLQAGVNQNELLSMLLSLPASPESKEIIAETIYSSSTTMDGRRFADEFLKRRKTADTEAAGNFTWSEALSKQATAPKPVNDGWNVSFKVVGKKKGRRE